MQFSIIPDTNGDGELSQSSLYDVASTLRVLMFPNPSASTQELLLCDSWATNEAKLDGAVAPSAAAPTAGTSAADRTSLGSDAASAGVPELVSVREHSVEAPSTLLEPVVSDVTFMASAGGMGLLGDAGGMPAGAMGSTPVMGRDRVAEAQGLSGDGATFGTANGDSSVIAA